VRVQRRRNFSEGVYYGTTLAKNFLSPKNRIFKEVKSKGQKTRWGISKGHYCRFVNFEPIFPASAERY